MRLLLVEDDADLGQAVQAHLHQAGHQVDWARRLADLPAQPAPELVLLDLGLPDGDGLQQLRQWRAQGLSVPVLVLTARDQVRDRIRGLQAGADDYLLKPFDLDELLARIEAVARRSRPASGANRGGPTDPTDPTGPADTLRLDLANRQAHRAGQALTLTRMEWAVLETLAGHRGRIYTRSEIEARLEQDGLADGQSNSLEVIVSRLRKKLGSQAIQTHRGLGYSLHG